MIDYQAIIDKYYGTGQLELRRILLLHSRAVAERALNIADCHSELRLDRQFIEEAAMLHDIGIIRCDAPGILCFGTEPYVRHGAIGAEMLRAEGLERHARVCERHTGAGLPGFLPETLEEQVICYADKFYSKSRLDRVKTVDEAAQSLAKFGEEGVARFRKWAAMFE